MAHDHQIVTAFREGSEVALYPLSRIVMPKKAQITFIQLLEEGLLHEVSREGFGASAACSALFSPTSAGMDMLRENSQENSREWIPSRIDWKEVPEMIDWSDPSLVVESFRGNVIGFDQEASSDEDHVLAGFNLLRINRTVLVAEEYDLQVVFESTGELQPYQSLAKNNAGEWLDLSDFGEKFCSEGECWGTLILLDHIKVRSAFIGLGLGETVIAKVLSHCAPGGGIVALTPFPLQYLGRGDIAPDDKGYRQSVVTLKRFYERMGFRELSNDSEVMSGDIRLLCQSHLSKRRRF